MPRFEKTSDKATGMWPEIYSQLGIKVGNGKHCACPVCGGVDRFKMDDKGRGLWFCNQCDPQSGDGISLVMKYFNMDFQTACRTIEGILNLPAEQRPVKKMHNKIERDPKIYLRQLYKQSEFLTGNCLGSIYLRQRGLSVIPKTLRFIKSCKEPSTNVSMPAILATFMNPDSEAITLHRIYMTNDGKKPNFEKHKLTLPPSGDMTGGAVRLFPYDPEKPLGIAEGIENGIAAHELFNIPVWATLSAQLMKSFEPGFDILKGAIIFGDNDKNYTGQKAAYDLANRLVIKNKIPVSVEIPDIPGDDWLDVLNKQKGA